MKEIDILHSQLKRIRSMNNFYHKQFLTDTRLMFITLYFSLSVAIFIEEIYLWIPIGSIFFLILLSYHANYLILSRTLSEHYEKEINTLFRKDLLIVNKVENNYLFPNVENKIVVAGLGKNFTWTSFTTLFITIICILPSYVAYIEHLQPINLSSYWIIIGCIYIPALLFGIWWFITGAGESKIYKAMEISDDV